MARRKFAAGNWKMHMTKAETESFCRSLRSRSLPLHRVDVAVFPPFPSLLTAAESLRDSGIGVGAQNMHPAPSGAFTGEVSAAMLLTVGCTYVIIGHSERRALFAESDDFVAQKAVSALAGGLVPLVCVGEQLSEREAGATESVVDRQLAAVLSRLDSPAGLVVAYEPVWAIGTGRNATPDQAQEVHALVRSRLREKFGGAGGDVRILYGGSVKPANAGELLARPDIDGVLVGGASLEVESFANIVEAAG